MNTLEYPCHRFDSQLPGIVNVWGRHVYGVNGTRHDIVGDRSVIRAMLTFDSKTVFLIPFIIDFLSDFVGK